jgi:hypothetical protein
MPGHESTNYKCIQWFVAEASLKSIFLYLYQQEAPSLIGDQTNEVFMDNMMQQSLYWMEQMVSPALIACAIGLVLGETLRAAYSPKQAESANCIPVFLYF